MRRTRIKKKETQLELLSQCVKIHQKVVLCERSELWFIRIWFWVWKFKLFFQESLNFKLEKANLNFHAKDLTRSARKVRKLRLFFHFSNIVCFLFFSSWTTINPDILCIFSQGGEALFFASAMLETRLFSVLFFTLSTFTSILFQGARSRSSRCPKGPSSKINRRSTLFHLADNKTKGRKIFWSTKLLRGWVIFAHCDKETHTKKWTLIYHQDNKRESPVAFTSFLPSNLCHFLSVCYH